MFSASFLLKNLTIVLSDLPSLWQATILLFSTDIPIFSKICRIVSSGFLISVFKGMQNIFKILFCYIVQVYDVYVQFQLIFHFFDGMAAITLTYFQPKKFYLIIYYFPMLKGSQSVSTNNLNLLWKHVHISKRTKF